MKKFFKSITAAITVILIIYFICAIFSGHFNTANWNVYLRAIGGSLAFVFGILAFSYMDGEYE